jgi:AcrR family transcriptional regulator
LTRAEGSDAWIEAGLAQLADSGVEGVRVEVVAQRLGVTKGGFYRRFKDRRDLLDAMLHHWANGRVAVIERQTELDGLSPAERLRALIQLFAERVNAQGMAIELAVRQAARTDGAAAKAVARVDEMRLIRVGALYAMLGYGAQEAQARAVLFYAFIFGQGLLHPSAGQRADLIQACAELLTKAD